MVGYRGINRDEMNTLTHLAIIPDGNREYAKKYGYSIKEGYQEGFDKAEEVFDWVLENPEIKMTTVYALSKENIKLRPRDQLRLLMRFYYIYFKKLATDRKVFENRVRIRVVGENPWTKLQKPIDKLHEITGLFDKRVLNICFGYSSIDEIRDANGNEDLLKIPQSVDLVIRTGDKHRLSNFLLYQCAYAEFYFSKFLWPELTKDEFYNAILFYKNSRRKFGGNHCEV